MYKNKILILEGGFNEEHEVSLATAKEIKKSLFNQNIEFKSLLVSPKNFEEKISKFSNKYICINALHGPYGEDGQIQKILEKLSFKFSHSSSEASRLGFNKELSKKTLRNTKVLMLDHEILESRLINKEKLIEIFLKLGSFILKPVASGSSFGVKIFKTINDINSFSNDLKQNLSLYKEHKDLLLEKYIKGRELTVAVVEKNKKSVSVEVTEIISNMEFFNYKAKYSPDIATHILPAKIPNEAYETCKTYAKIAHDTINCRGLSRSDFIYYNDKIYFIEINTQPGLTSLSLVPEQLKFKKTSFDQMIKNLIECSL
ncbi:ATP-grasp domain-containing protein [Alphaproteobacteria bacterium]|nr:ATP-grasp domain-containing protein [Alphaproteobacteria bacterium]